MPFCPVCQAEYREGFTRCNSCEVDLVPSLAPEDRMSGEDVAAYLEGKELVAVTRGLSDVVLEAQDLLRQNRVAALMTEDQSYVPEPGHPKRMLLVVAKEQLDRAVQVLSGRFREMLANEGLTAPEEFAVEKCPACGHAVPEDAEECPECGLVVGKA